MENQALDICKKEGVDMRNQIINYQTQMELDSRRVEKQKGEIEDLRTSKYKIENNYESEHKML